MKYKASFVIVYFWLAVLLVSGLLLFNFAEKEERLSEQENRMLSGFPELSAENIFSGDFSSDFENYLSDGVWGRDSIVGVSESLLRVFSAASSEEEKLLEDIAMSDELKLEGVDEDESPQVEEPIADSTEEPAVPFEDISTDTTDLPESEDESVDAAQQVTSIEGYGFWIERTDGTYSQMLFPKESHIKSAARMLNAFRSFTPEDGNVFYVNIPMKNAGLLLREKYYSRWFENISDGITQYADDGVHVLNVPSFLEQEIIDGKHIYFESDHHWTPLAAHILVNECLRIQGLPAIPYDEYDYKVGLFTNAKLGAKDDLEMLYPLQNVNGNVMPHGEEGPEFALINYDANTYMAYLCGDSRTFVRYTTGFSTGRNALVIGDSFSNVFAPYLMPYYDEVYKIDARKYSFYRNGGSISELMKKYEIDDVYLVVSYATGVTSKVTYYELEAALYGES